jgi:hypothetical protein
MWFKDQGLTGKVIKAFYVFNNTLGFGFLEKVYVNSFMKFSVLNLGAKPKKKGN